jgi:hypothetical protein
MAQKSINLDTNFHNKGESHIYVTFALKLEKVISKFEKLLRKKIQNPDHFGMNFCHKMAQEWREKASDNLKI